MIRSKASAKMAYAITGKPANMTSKQSSLWKKINKVTITQDTRLVR